MTCLHCGGTRFIGNGDLRTCANPACAKFVPSNVFDKLRAELTPEEQSIEQAIRSGNWHPPVSLAQAFETTGEAA